jgi:hypothetical protein
MGRWKRLRTMTMMMRGEWRCVVLCRIEKGLRHVGGGREGENERCDGGRNWCWAGAGDAGESIGLPFWHPLQ